ncbi:hypothetical protein C4F50_16130 [Flavobacterium sp. KB82]|uniref:Uncharacterized protein n=1 Tax=Flavobacterium hungaricum TaxID=2082725 RepID=A0ABR9TM75_9FLAO|nr:hypothetical protein [Flavobacterium hungaricum]
MWKIFLLWFWPVRGTLVEEFGSSKSFEPNLIELDFAGFLFLKNFMHHDAATKLRWVNYLLFI